MKKLDELLKNVSPIEDAAKGKIKGGYVDISPKSPNKSPKGFESVSVTGTCACDDGQIAISK